MANKPNNPALWSKAKSLAKQKFDVYPSAYANGWAAKWYKGKGGTWRKAEYGMEIPYMEEGGNPEWLIKAQLEAQGYSGNALQQKMSSMAQGGEPQNAGFQALPDYVQAKILSNMGYGGMAYPFMEEGGEPNGEMALGQMAAVSDKMSKLLQFVKPDDNLDPWIASKLAVMDHSADAISDYMMYGAEGDEEEMEEPEGLPMPEMKNGGGIPDRYKNMGFTKVGVKKNSTRPGKKWMVLAKKGDQYKVVHGGYDGMKDFSQHGSEKRKTNFWNRMGGKNSSKATDPFSPLYWHKRFGTWEEGGEVDGDYEMKEGGSTWSGNAFYKMGGMPCYECGGMYAYGGNILMDTTVAPKIDTTKKPNPVQATWSRTVGFMPSDTAKMQQMRPQFNSAKEKLEQRIKEKQQKQYAEGGIHLDPKKKGTFKAQATRMGMGVQEAAAAILNAPEGKYSPEMRKKANFARNFAKEIGGELPQAMFGAIPSMISLGLLNNRAKKAKGQLMQALPMIMPMLGGMQAGGLVEGAEMEVTPEQAELLRQQGYDFEII